MTASEHQDAPAPGIETGDGPGISDDPDELREQIGRTRAELGETVEALAAKTDVKARVEAKVSAGKEELRDRFSAGTAELKQKVGGVKPERAREVVTSVPERLRANPKRALVAAGAVLAGWVIRRRRRTA